MNEVVRRGILFGGPATQQFEDELAAYVGVRHCAGTGSGTDSLTLALAAVGVGPGDKVATVANAGFYTSVACRRIGAKPIYVDVDPTTAVMDAEHLQAVLDGSFAAVVVTHLYGHVVDLARHLEICDRFGVPLIEDCAQAVGGRRDGRSAGSFGSVGCFSFYPTKNLGAVGDAGAVVSDDTDVMRRVRAMAQYGWSEKYTVTEAQGMNARLDELQAAVLLTRLAALDQMNEVRRAIAVELQRAAARHGCHMFFEDDPSHVAHLAVLQVNDRDAVRRQLAQRDVQTEVHYPIPDYRQPVVVAEGEPHDQLPVTEKLADSVLTVPCFPTMRGEERELLINALDMVLEGQGCRSGLAGAEPVRVTR